MRPPHEEEEEAHGDEAMGDGAAGAAPSGGGNALNGAVDALRGGVSQLETMLGALVAAAAAERDSLARERAQLEAERRALEREHRRVQQAMSDSEQVTLNVGGSRFTTTVSTLRGAPFGGDAVGGAGASLFSAMFSGRHELRRSADGSIFIDRDGRHFADILNYLRTGQLAYPPDGNDFKYLLELRSEAEFYGLVGLTALVDRFPHGRVRAPRAGRVDTAARWALGDGSGGDEDGAEGGGGVDAIVFAVDRPCQLLGVGLCGTPGAYSATVSVLEVRAGLADYEDMSLMPVIGTGALTVTAADGECARCDLVSPVALSPGPHAYMVTLAGRGSDSYSAEDCLQEIVVAAGGGLGGGGSAGGGGGGGAGGGGGGVVRVSVLPYESANGTTEAHGQFPELYFRL